MTLKDKKNKREYNRKLRAEGGGGGGTSGKSQEKSSSKKDAKPPKDGHVSNFSGVKEDPAKLISEANQRFVETEMENVSVSKVTRTLNICPLTARRRRL